MMNGSSHNSIRRESGRFASGSGSGSGSGNDTGANNNTSGSLRKSGSSVRFSSRLGFGPAASSSHFGTEQQEDHPEGEENADEDNDSNVSISSSEDGGEGEGEGPQEQEVSPHNRRQSRSLSASMVKISKSGSRAVKWSKILVFGMIIVVATVIIVLTYVYLKRRDRHDFEFGFRNLSLEMLFRVNTKMSSMESAFRTVSNMVTAYTVQNQSQWPFVTVPNFQIRAITTQQMSKAVVLGLSPLVPGQDIGQWEAYSMTHQYWMDDTLNQQEKLFDTLYNSNAMQVVWQEDSRDNALPIPSSVYQIKRNGYPTVINPPIPKYVLPMWELAPAPRHNASIVNYDLLNHTVFANAMDQLMRTREAVLTPAFPDIQWWWNGAQSTSVTSDTKKQDQQQPYSLLLQPVFEQISQDENIPNRNNAIRDPQQPRLVGVIHAAVPWDVYLEQNLANNKIRGLYVVLDWVPTSEGCHHDSQQSSTPPLPDANIQPTFTYRVDGKRATFLGYADLHEQNDGYEDMMESMDFLVPTGRYQGINLTGENECLYGHYQWRVYPSKELKSTNFSRSNVSTWLYAMGVVLIFCFAGGTFLSYDYLVKLRQQAVLDTAIRSNAIVSSLFPSNVRDRIMKDAEEQAKQEQRQRKLERKQRKKEKRKKKKATSRTAGSQNGDESSRNNDPYNVPELKDFLNATNGKNAAVNNNDLGYGEAKPAEAMPEPAAAFATKPIADLFPAATVLFADIVGFTAWSSVREPTQVFQLLETLYHHFDEMANRRKVFKVETIGDCYVAVTGLPEPRDDHAVIMARFAKDIMEKMKRLCQRLEVALGPDTGDLQLRIGIHSGPVTAGVLRGEKSRFQLFGDTVNTAARMESTGAPSKMHISKETADLLKAAGKKWAKRREDKVHAKGKGELETYWLAPGRAGSSASRSECSSQAETVLSGSADDEESELVGDLKTIPKVSNRSGVRSLSMGAGKRRSSFLSSGSLRSFSLGTGSVKKSMEESFRRSSQHLLRDSHRSSQHAVVARRDALKHKNAMKDDDSIFSDENTTSPVEYVESSDGDSDDGDEFGGSEPRSTVLEEVKEIIQLPVFDPESAQYQEPVSEVELDKVVKSQCLDFVREVAAMYRWNPFHNFEHASHVIMSVVKLLSRIVTPSNGLAQAQENANVEHEQLIKSLHDKTYGITSDPLTQFAVVFSALIHDLDHPGVPNTTLVKEGTSLARLYKNKSVAEQNSVDLAWDLLKEERFKELRSTIYATKEEKERFRQLVVNSVMATDIVDKELKELRNSRWERAFQDKPIGTDEELHDDVNRKATIVIEHIIQASDIAHTMQHWHIYRKWNERFFEENWSAFKEGRTDKNPAAYWYEGEIGFFNFYIIPLAKKLKECGVFGVSSDEYLNYAETNLKQWTNTGKEVVESYVEKYCQPKSDIATKNPTGEQEDRD